MALNRRLSESCPWELGAEAAAAVSVWAPGSSPNHRAARRRPTPVIGHLLDGLTQVLDHQYALLLRLEPTLFLE